MPNIFTLYTDQELDHEIAVWKAAFRAVASGKRYKIQGPLH